MFHSPLLYLPEPLKIEDIEFGVFSAEVTNLDQIKLVNQKKHLNKLEVSFENVKFLKGDLVRIKPRIANPKVLYKIIQNGRNYKFLLKKDVVQEYVLNENSNVFGLEVKTDDFCILISIDQLEIYKIKKGLLVVLDYPMLIESSKKISMISYIQISI